MPVWLKRLLWFAAAVALVFAVGFYREGIQGGESVHFSLNYPASGTEAGGIGAMGTEGKVVVDVGSIGLLKRVVQPNVVNLSSHWVRNVGDTPLRIRLAAEGFKYPLRWESTEKTWNEEQHSIGRELAPGSTATVDWFITLPKPIPATASVDKGDIVVYDAESGKKLTSLPIRVINTKAGAVPGGS